jgi:hypothetical protein
MESLYSVLGQIRDVFSPTIPAFPSMRLGPQENSQNPLMVLVHYFHGPGLC